MTSALLAVAGLLALAFGWRYALTRPGVWRPWPFVFATAAGAYSATLLTGSGWAAVLVAVVSAAIAVRDVWPVLTHRHDPRFDHDPFRRLP